MKRYITYKRKEVNWHFLDPNTNNAFEKATINSIFQETPYQNAGVFLGVIEYPESTTQEIIDDMLQKYSEFNFSFIAENEANLFLQTIWEITVKDYIFTDNRPLTLY